MANPKNELLERAVSDVVPRPLAEEKLKSGEPLRVYFGIDPTGPKLHLGHSVPLLKMRAFQDAGHHVILVIGSFTAMIGDPSGQDQMRQPLTREQVQKNFETYMEQAKRILDRGKLEVRYNHEWLEEVDFGKIIELASHFTVQQMLKRDMFKERQKKEIPIGSQEFLYPLMVGYDSVVLDVDGEIGGNDQLFNMLAGRTLQTAYGKRDKFILTTKLIEGPDGRKMSKTYNNCVYLTDSPKEMYGRLMSIPDSLITLYLECCTLIPMEEIKDVERAMKEGGNPKDFKIRLAREIVTMYHSADEARKAEAEFTNVFSEKGIPSEMPEVKVKKGSLLVDILVECKLVSSKAEARRLIEQGGVKMNEKVVRSIMEKVEQGIVKIGKRKFIRISYDQK